MAVAHNHQNHLATSAPISPNSNGAHGPTTQNLRSTKHLVAISEGDGARGLTQPMHQKQKVLQPDADRWITPKIRCKPKPHPTEHQLPAETAPLPSPCDVDDLDDSKLPREPATHLALASIVNITNATGKSYSDLTGRFPNRSDTGNLYVLVFYSYDDNAILVKALRSRSDGDQLAAYQHIIKRANKGATLRTHWMDNEASKAIKQLLINKGMDYQLTPPHMHRINAAERAIRTFKITSSPACVLQRTISQFACGIACSDRPKSH
jgi:hypothetical protein